jgi:uncharacterized protein (TIGR02246 family)
VSITPHPVLDRLVAASNAGDAAGFAAVLADDVRIVSHPGRVLQGSASEVRTHYEKVFATNPGNRTEVVHRVVLGDRVVDHERVRRSADAEPFDVIAINTIEGDRVASIEFISNAKAGE